MKKITALLRNIFTAQLTASAWSKITVFTVFAVIGSAALISLVVDPFYRYHEPLFYDKVYYEIYYTAPALLQREDYDLLMLGTSMTRNFFIEDIDNTFNCKSIKLAASGGTMKDLKKFFDVALTAKQDQLKHVVLSLDIYPLNKKNPHYKDAIYMYEQGHAQDYRYLFSRKTFSSMAYLIKRKTRPQRQRAHQADRNRMFATEYKNKPYGLQEVIKDAAHNQRSHHTQTPYNAEVHQDNLHNELLVMFDQNPQIKFTVYLPPYHIYTYCQSEEFHEADALIKQRSEVMKELLKRKNVTLHDFQAAADYVCNHDYFSDVQHFSNVAAKKILADIAGGRRQIKTVADVERNEQDLRKLIAENMPLYYQNLKKYLKK